MSGLSPSELVYLHADQFVQPRASPEISSLEVLTNKRKVNRRLLAIELVRAGILANLAVQTLQLKQLESKGMAQTLDQLNGLGKVGSLMGGILKSVAGLQKPRSHLQRLQNHNPWHNNMFEATILDKPQDQPLEVSDLVFELFGNQYPSVVVVDLMRNNLLQRGMVEKQKKLFGTVWSLSDSGKDALRKAELQPIKKMYAHYQNLDSAGWAQLEKDIAHGFARSDSSD